MFNLRFILNPGSCGWFCLRFILKKNIKKKFYLSFYDMKSILNEEGYYCSCLRVKNLENIKGRCVSLIKNGEKEFHFVIILKVIKGVVYFYDPLYVGVRKKSVDSFSKKWMFMCLFYCKI